MYGCFRKPSQGDPARTGIAVSNAQTPRGAADK